MGLPGDRGVRPTSGPSPPPVSRACCATAAGQGRDADVLGRHPARGGTAGGEGLQLEEAERRTPGFLPGDSPWTRSLVDYSPWGRKVGHD